jgi:hypothetical protein
MAQSASARTKINTKQHNPPRDGPHGARPGGPGQAARREAPAWAGRHAIPSGSPTGR